MAAPRGIVREDRFEAEAAAIQPSVRRLDEALRYVEQQLARFPDSGIPSSVPGLWVAPIRLPTLGGIARASIFYTFDEQRVSFHSVRLAP